MKVAGVLGNYRSLWSILSDFRRSIALLWVADSSILFWHSLQIRKQKKKGAHERTHYWTSRSKDCLHIWSSIVTIDNIDVGLLSLCFWSHGSRLSLVDQFSFSNLCSCSRSRKNKIKKEQSYILLFQLRYSCREESLWIQFFNADHLSIEWDLSCVLVSHLILTLHFGIHSCRHRAIFCTRVFISCRIAVLFCSTQEPANEGERRCPDASRF